MDIVNPESVGLSTARLRRLGAGMQRYVEEGKYAGIISLLARRGQVAHLDCYGVRDLASGEPMQPDTIFRIFSMTKPITSVAVLMLMEEGRFQLSDPISRYLPYFDPEWVYADEAPDGGMYKGDREREITLHHLLTHTAGLTYGFNPEEDGMDARYQKAGILRLDETAEEKVRRLAELPLRYQPGERWHYSVATDVLGHLVEVVSGQSLADFFQERIFAPLGMEDTAFYVPEEKLPRLAETYGPGEGGRLKLLSAPITAEMSVEEARRLAHLDKREQPRFLSGGGGLVSTVGDYLRFALMLRNGGELDGVRLLGRKTVEFMTMNHLPAGVFSSYDKSRGFGLGVGVLLDVARSRMPGSIGTYGWGGAATTKYWYDPQEDLLGLLMIQFMPDSYYPIANDFKILSYQALT